MSQAGRIGVTDGQLPPDVPLIFTGNSGSGSAIANIFDIVGSGGVSTNVVGNILTITAVSSGFTWNVVTSVSPVNPIILVTENGYITKGLALVSFMLPGSAAVGDTYKIIGYNAMWTIGQNANQTITLGIKTTTSGVGGSIASTGVNDTIEMICVTANLEWIITDVTGNITFI